MTLEPKRGGRGKGGVGGWNFFGFLPNTSLLVIISVGFIRFVVLLSDQMRPAKSSPSSKAEPAGTLLASLRREG